MANVRCAEILADQLRSLVSDQAWKTLSEQAHSGTVVPGFGAAAYGLVDSCLRGYEAEASYFDARVRGEKLEELQAKVQGLLQPLVSEQTSALSAIKLRWASRCYSTAPPFCIPVIVSSLIQNRLICSRWGLALLLCNISHICCWYEPREHQQEVKLGSAADSTEGFAALSARTRAKALESFAQVFATELCVPGMPWDGQVRAQCV